MIKRIKLKELLLTTIIIFLFSACGGGSDTEDTESMGSSGNTISSKSSDSVDANIKITVACTTPATIPTYYLLQSNDVIVKGSDDTEISLYHDSNNERRVCLVKGSASVIRN